MDSLAQGWRVLGECEVVGSYAGTRALSEGEVLGSYTGTLAPDHDGFFPDFAAAADARAAFDEAEPMIVQMNVAAAPVAESLAPG